MSSDLVHNRPGGFDIRPASGKEATPIHEGIWMSAGLSNSYLIVTSEGRVVINTGMGFEAPHHKRLFDAVDTAPLRYILLTQGHVDHVGGVDCFKAEGTEVVAQENNRACQADDARIRRFRVQRSAVFWAEAVSRANASQRARPADVPAPVQSIPVPTLTFRDRFDFELGGWRFELLATPGGETIDSMCVWLPDRGIAFVGNQFSALFPHVPNLVTLRGDRCRYVPSYIESLERVLALGPELLVTGHFDPIRGRREIRAELERLRDAIQFVHDATVDGMNRGDDVHTLMREIRLPDRLRVGEGYGKVAWNVRTIWEGYAGWFHHRSTSELFGVPASQVHPEIVELAGGADAVAERAARRVDAGEPLEAIHLAEMALTANPGNRAALEVMLTAHRRLLEESGGENFWEVGWLRHQIAKARSALDG